MTRRSRAGPAATILCVVLSFSGEAHAGGPLLFADDGSPLAWDTSRPVVVRPGNESLGSVETPVDLLRHAVEQWNGVSTATVKLEIGQALPPAWDNMSTDLFEYVAHRNDGVNPVLFDEDGSIFRDLFGPDSGVLAVAGPSLILPATGKLIKGFALFNGEEATRSRDEEAFKAVVTHEIGHLLGLDHTQINGTRLGERVPGYDITAGLENVATMYPILLGRSVRPHPMATLHKDDRVALSALYPASFFAAQSGSITGFVFDFDGVTHLQGVNVIARNVADPLDDAVSYVSGQRASAENGFEPRDLRGVYELRGLTPGADYELSIEEVASYLTEGSSVGPLDPPNDLDPTESAAFLEFWNGAGEIGTNPPDDPLEAESVRVRAGETLNRIDFIFNGSAPRLNSVIPSSGDYTESHEVMILGTNLSSFTEVRLSGPTTARLEATPVSSSRIDATVPAFLVPGAYRVLVTTAKGTSAEAITYRVTESPPIVEAFTPNVVRNDRSNPITVGGEHLLGARSIRLVATGLPDVELENVSVALADPGVEGGPPSIGLGLYVATGDVPRGTLPRSYRVVVINTAGSSAPSADTLEVVELAPLLSGDVEPSWLYNSRNTDVRVAGENLAGTRSVRLVGESGEFELAVRTTSLTEVVATVPAGLPPGAYSLVLSNTTGTVTAAAEITIVQPSGGGGGGGCSAVAGTDPKRTMPDFPLLIVALFVLRVIMSRGVFRARSSRRSAPSHA